MERYCLPVSRVVTHLHRNLPRGLCGPILQMRKLRPRRAEQAPAASLRATTNSAILLPMEILSEVGEQR